MDRERKKGVRKYQKDQRQILEPFCCTEAKFLYLLDPALLLAWAPNYSNYIDGPETNCLFNFKFFIRLDQ